MELFSVLNGVSPWIWAALGIMLLALEMVVAGFILVWPGLAALSVAALLWAVPDLSGDGQIAAFAALALVFTLLGRWAVARYGPLGSEAPLLNRRTRRLIGRRATVVAAESADTVRVVIDGVPWSARVAGATPAPGDTVTITGVDGMLLTVGRIGQP
ncbi:MAG: NfeD family protein [Pseudomonadota bacterium]